MRKREKATRYRQLQEGQTWWKTWGVPFCHTEFEMCVRLGPRWSIRDQIYPRSWYQQTTATTKTTDTWHNSFTDLGLQVTEDNGPGETEAHRGPSLLPWEGFQAEVPRGETQTGLSPFSELRRQSQSAGTPRPLGLPGPSIREEKATPRELQRSAQDSYQNSPRRKLLKDEWGKLCEKITVNSPQRSPGLGSAWSYLPDRKNRRIQGALGKGGQKGLASVVGNNSPPVNAAVARLTIKARPKRTKLFPSNLTDSQNNTHEYL